MAIKNDATACGTPRATTPLSRLARSAAVGTLSVLLSSLMPTVGMPVRMARAEEPVSAAGVIDPGTIVRPPTKPTNPGDWFDLDPDLDRIIVKRKVRADVFSCRVARYQAAYAKTFSQVLASTGVAEKKRNDYTRAADQFVTDACGGKPKAALAALNGLRGARDAIPAAYAAATKVDLESAKEHLIHIEAAMLRALFSCKGASSIEGVGDYITGASSQSISVNGTRLGGTGGGVQGLSLSEIGSCGGGGGGGGTNGSGDPSRFSFPEGLDAPGFGRCMAPTKNLMGNDCGFTATGANDAQEKTDDEAERDDKDKKKPAPVKVETDKKTGTVKVSQKGSSTGSNSKPEEDTGLLDVETWAIDTDDIQKKEWGYLVSDMLKAAPIVATIALAATPVGLAVWVGVGLGAAAVGWSMGSHYADVYNRQHADRGPKLCPVQVGGDIAWVTNGAGQRINTDDVVSVCTCETATKGTDKRCEGKAQRELNNRLKCGVDPFAFPVDPKVCQDVVMNDNPHLTRYKIAEAQCAYRDCGWDSSPTFSGGKCSCSAGDGFSGGLIPDIDLIINPEPPQP